MDSFKNSISLIKEMRIDEAFIFGNSTETMIGQPNTKETLKILSTDTPVEFNNMGFCKKQYNAYLQSGECNYYALENIKNELIAKHNRLKYSLSVSTLIFKDELTEEKYPEFYYYTKLINSEGGGTIIDFGGNKVFICKSLFRLRKKEFLNIEVYRFSNNMNLYKFTQKNKNYTLDTYFYGIVL